MEKNFKLNMECHNYIVREVAIALLNHVLKGETVTYGLLASELPFPMNPRNLDHPLGVISDACKENGYPTVSAVVFNYQTLVPGNGFFQYFYPASKTKAQREAKFKELVKVIRSFPEWSRVLKAFQNA